MNVLYCTVYTVHTWKVFLFLYVESVWFECMVTREQRGGTDRFVSAMHKSMPQNLFTRNPSHVISNLRSVSGPVPCVPGFVKPVLRGMYLHGTLQWRIYYNFTTKIANSLANISVYPTTYYNACILSIKYHIYWNIITQYFVKNID